MTNASTIISSGTLLVGTSTNLGMNGADTITIGDTTVSNSNPANNTGLLTYAGASIPQNITFQTAAGNTTTVTLGSTVDANSTFVGSILVNNNTGVILQAVPSSSGTNAVTFAGNISGSGGLTKTGGGTVILTGNNGYFGNNAINAGTLQVNTNSIVNNTAINSSTAKLAFNQLTAGGYSGTITGPGAVSMIGSGTLTLGASNSYQGGTTISAGSVWAAKNQALGTGPVVLTTGGNLTVTGSYFNSGGLVGNFYNNPAGSGTQTNYNSGLSAMLAHFAGETLGATQNTSAWGPTMSTAGNLVNCANFPNPYNTNAVNFDALWQGQFDATTAGTYGFGTTSDDGSVIYIDGVLVDNNAYAQGSTFRSGTVPLTAGLHNIAIAYNQGTGNLVFDAEYQPPGAGSFTGPPNSLLGIGQASDQMLTIASLSGDSSTTVSLTGGSLTIAGSNAATTTFAGVMSGSGALTMAASSSMLTLSSTANSYSGTTTVSAGTLAFTSIGNADGVTPSALGSPAAANGTITLGHASAPATNGTLQFIGSANSSSNRTIALNNDSTLDASGSGTLFLTGGTAVNLGSGGVNLTLTGTGQGVIQGSMVSGTGGAAGAVTKSGPGTWTLTGSNTYSGSTTITGGTLQLGDGTSGHDGSLTTSGVTDNASLVYNLYGTQTVGYAIGGSGTLSKTGNGTLVVSSSNGYSGGTIISAGSLLLANSNGSALGTGPVTISGGTLDATQYAQSIGALTVNGPGSLNLSVTNTLTLSGSANFGGTLNLFGITSGTEDLINYGALGYSNSFSITNNVPNGFKLQYNPTQLDLVRAGNMSQLWVGGAAPTGSLATSTTSISFGRVMLNSAQSTTVPLFNNGSSDLATSYASVSASGQATTNPTSSQLINTLANINAGLNTTTAGVSAGTVTIHNLAADSGGTGLGSDNGNALIIVNGTVLAQRSIQASTVAIPGVQHAGANLSGNNYTTTLRTVGDDNSCTRVTVSGGGTVFNGSSGPGTTQTRSLPGPAAIVLTSGTLGTLSVSTAEAGSVGDTVPYPALAVTYTASVFSGNGRWTGTAPASWGSGQSSNWADVSTGGAGAAPGTFSGFVSTDSATFDSASGGTITLDNANPSLNAINFSNSAAIYTIAQGTGTGGTLTLNGSNNTTLINSTSGLATVTLSGTQVISAPILLSTSAAFVPDDSGQLILAGNIGDNGNNMALVLAASGALQAGSLILSGTANSYTGGTYVESGTLYVNNTGAIEDGSSLIVGAGGMFLYDPTAGAAANEPAISEKASDHSLAPVPEPGTLALLSVAGIVAAAAIWRRRRNRGN